MRRRRRHPTNTIFKKKSAELRKKSLSPQKYSCHRTRKLKNCINEDLITCSGTDQYALCNSKDSYLLHPDYYQKKRNKKKLFQRSTPIIQLNYDFLLNKNNNMKLCKNTISTHLHSACCTLHLRHFRFKRTSTAFQHILTGIFVMLIAFSITQARVINHINAQNGENMEGGVHHRHHYRERRSDATPTNPNNHVNNDDTIVDRLKKSDDAEDVVVRTKLGKIRGLKQKFENIDVNAFLGVPYAQNPVGAKRFHLPEEVISWEGEFMATSLAQTCYLTIDTMFPQFPGAEMWNPPNELSEDCLSMNIWVPTEKHDGTVLVWIYGGGFFSGSPSLELYDGRVLVARERTIVVNINYRLGAFGFLYFGRNSIVPGNMGLMDQQLALKWIYENIGYFGGDPHRITLFGESAGAASSSAHLFAPGSRNYFKRMILKSGSMLNNWATKSKDGMFEISLALARRLNCTNHLSNILKNDRDTLLHLKPGQHSEEMLNKDDVERIVRCMTKVSAFTLQKEANQLSELPSLPMTFAFVPIEEDENFFQGNLFEKIRNRDFKKDVSVMLGTVKDEGTYWLPYYLHKYGFVFNHTISAEDRNNQALINESDYVRALDAFLPYFGDSPLIRHALMHAYARVALPPNDHEEHNHNNPSTISQLALDTNELRLNERWRDGIARFLGDYFFTCPLVDFADILADNIFGSVFMYYFTKRSSANPWPKWMGVMHGYEIEYVFGLPLRLPQQYVPPQLESEKRFSEKIMEFWSAFSRTGEPIEYWPKYNRITRKSLVLNDEISQGTSHRIYVDVHGKLCRLLKEAKNVASLEYQSKLSNELVTGYALSTVGGDLSLIANSGHIKGLNYFMELFLITTTVFICYWHRLKSFI